MLLLSFFLSISLSMRTHRWRYWGTALVWSYADRNRLQKSIILFKRACREYKYLFVYVWRKIYRKPVWRGICFLGKMLEGR